MAELGRREAVVRREAAGRAAEEGRRRGCLWCRASDGGFTSVEHIVPETLGNSAGVCDNVMLLPAGVVCDRCNHGPLATIDAALCDFGPITLMRVTNSVPTKAGKQPMFKFDNGTFACRSPNDLVLQLDSPKWRHEVKELPGGGVRAGFTAQKHDVTPKKLQLVHRAIIKQAVEFAYLDLGPDELLSASFDHERAIVLNGGHHGYIAIADQADIPNARNVSVHYSRFARTSDGHPMLGVIGAYYGVLVLTDSVLQEPGGSLPPGMIVRKF